MKPKRVIVLADMHCGHIAGLTPTPFQCNGGNKIKDFAVKLERECWSAFNYLLKNTKQRFDIAIWNGDLIDGRGERSGGTELITSDRDEQGDIASRVVETVGANRNFFCYGTAYHTGQCEDFENRIAERFGGDIKSHQFIEVNGVVIDVKHKIGGSSIPHGRATAIKREQLWNLLWAEQDGQPKADIIMRSHVHYYDYTGNDNYYAVVTPALQAAYTKYGARACSGTISWGFLTIEINARGEYHCVRHKVPVASVKCVATKA